jgi:hypothetical protein
MNLWHKHQWVPVAVDQSMVRVMVNNRTGEQVGQATPITKVLQKCACGDVCARTLVGSWTLNDLKRAP